MPQVVLTDLAQVLPVIRNSIELNGLSKHRYMPHVAMHCKHPVSLDLVLPPRSCVLLHRPDAGNAEAVELVWNAVQSSATIAALAARHLDLLIAADACYDDQVVTISYIGAAIHWWLHVGKWTTKTTVENAGWRDTKSGALFQNLQHALQPWQDEGAART